MSVTIDNDLLKFEEKMSDIGNINSTLSKLTSKLDEVKTASDSATANLANIYQGTGLSTILGAFASIDAAVEGIKGSLDNGPKKAITLSEKLVSDIKDLKKIQEEITKLESELSNAEETMKELEEEIERELEESQNTQDVEELNTTITDLEEKIKVLLKDFKTKQDSCKTKLSELKALNPTIDITVKTQEVTSTVDSGIGEVKPNLQGLEEGKVNKVVYTGKNGRTITSFIYLPKGASTTEGLGVTLHLGGDGSQPKNGGAL